MSGTPPLAGTIVVDLSSGIAGGYCTKILADGGAEVIKVEAPEGDPLRRWSASGAEIAPGDDGPLFQFLAGSKRSVVADPTVLSELEFVQELVRGAEAVVWSAGSRLAELPALAPWRMHALATHASVLAITPFGLEGPWIGRAWTESTLQAWAGGLGQRGSVERPPVIAGGRMADWVTGMIAAVALLASRHRTIESGIGELLDASMLESLVFTQTMHPVTFNSIAGHPHRPIRMINLPDVHKTRDGYVGFMVVTGQQWLDFCSMIGRADWLEDESLVTLNKRCFRRSELIAAIDSWMAERTTAEVIEVASALRIPVAQVGNGATVPTFDQFAEQRFYVKNPRGGFLQPDVPYTLSSGASRRDFEPAPRLGEHGEGYRRRPRSRSQARPAAGSANGKLPFEGLRIADFTAFWAGPVVGHLLAMLGADVIHVESAERPDGMRFNTVRSMKEDRWWEWAPLYQGTNTSKRGLTLDLRKLRGIELARRLVAKCDVVLDNYSPRVMESWGLGYDEIRRLRADAIMVRMPAFGLSGPWRERTGYAQTMEQVSGLAWITGYPDQGPQIPNGPCDPIAGTHATAALLLALEHRRRTGKGMLVEVAMVGGALNIAAEQVIEYSATGTLLERTGNRGPTAAPQGVYLSADVDGKGIRDRWVAIAVESDEQWGRLRASLGDPQWARDPALATMAGRRAAHDAIDRELAAWCNLRGSEQIVDELWSAGVPVAKVLLPHEQNQLPPLAARGFYETLDHPVVGAHPYATYPVRFSAGPTRFHRRHSPLLGEHNDEVLCGLLGLSRDEIADLEREGVIGTRPGKAQSW